MSEQHLRNTDPTVSMDLYDWLAFIILVIASILCLTGCVSANRKIVGNPDSKAARNVGIAGDAAMTLVCPPAGLIAIGYDMYHSRTKNAPPKVVVQQPLLQQTPTTTMAPEQTGVSVTQYQVPVPVPTPAPIALPEVQPQAPPSHEPKTEIQVITIPVQLPQNAGQQGTQGGSIIVTVTTKTIKR